MASAGLALKNNKLLLFVASRLLARHRARSVSVTSSAEMKVLSKRVSASE